MAQVGTQGSTQRAEFIAEQVGRGFISGAASGLGISDYDVRSDTLHWSDELRAILGVDADEPPDPATALALIHPDDQAEASDQERRARQGDFTHQYRGVRRIYRKSDGALRWVATQGHPIYDDHGRLIVAMNHNSDMGDAWEHADDAHYPAPMTATAYRFGVNYVIYAMTH